MSDPIELDMNDIYNYIKQERRIELSKILPTHLHKHKWHYYTPMFWQIGRAAQKVKNLYYEQCDQDY